MSVGVVTRTYRFRKEVDVETLRAIVTRRATSEFKDDGRILESTVGDLLRAAMSAPSAEKKKPWHFVVLHEQKGVEDLALLLRESNSLRSASMCVVVCADSREQKHMGQWVLDCAAASENLLLAAHDQGLGSTWSRVFPSKSRMRETAELLHVPQHVTPFSALFLGEPVKVPNGRAAPLVKDKIHLEKW
jgi:nitroreductase